ncbi:tetraspanin-33 isoform X3 [Xiphias gladius]|uniref:tetraspanin-33 isoform X3 n=1 Tax=Xiphias gladius TaxID=8245 RepID=UPI001A97E77B|nr:tetraspanin-33 isoform X3 [Xiphias gladius]
MGGRRRGVPGSNEDFSFVSPVVKYLLFMFNFIFWIISLVMVSIGVYARMMKHAEAALACLSVDPAIMLMVVGVLMFIITFCGCVGSLRENICLLQTFCICLTVIFLLQLTAGILGFVFSDTARSKVTEMINNAIVHYRDDIDLQNLIDFGQMEIPDMASNLSHLKCLYVLPVRLLWWCHVHRLVPEHILQLQEGQPQQRTLLCPLLLLYHIQRQGGYQHHVRPGHAGLRVP